MQSIVNFGISEHQPLDLNFTHEDTSSLHAENAFSSMLAGHRQINLQETTDAGNFAERGDTRHRKDTIGSTIDIREGRKSLLYALSQYSALDLGVFIVQLKTTFTLARNVKRFSPKG